MINFLYSNDNIIYNICIRYGYLFSGGCSVKFSLSMHIPTPIHIPILIPTPTSIPIPIPITNLGYI